jgi:nucleosome assembly protein 1-like 1
VTSQKEEESEEEPEEEEEEEEEEGEEVDLSSLPKNVFRRVKAVRVLQEEFDLIEEEYTKARVELEKKFETQKKAFYAKRDPIISGEVDVPKVEGVEEEGSEETDDKDIPHFWLTVLTSHPSISDAVTEEDVPALEALTNVTADYDDEYTSFTLTFHFKENEYFENKTLTKNYVVSPSLLDDKNPNLSDITGSTIEWKAGKNLCVTEIKKKQKAKSGRNKGQVRTVTRTVPKASFFHFFDEHKEEEEQEEEEEEDEEAMGKTKFSAEEDYDIGHTIRTTLIPEAILWFTGEAGADMDDYMYGDDEEDDDEEGEDDEDDGEEDDDEDDKKKKTGKASKINFDANKGFATTAPAPGANGQQPECKQN